MSCTIRFLCPEPPHRLPDYVMSRDIGTSRTHAGSGFGLGLVVAVGVEGELSQELAGGGVDDADVEVVDDGLADVLGNRRSQRVRC